MRRMCRRFTWMLPGLLMMSSLLGAAGCVTQREPQVLVEPTYSHVREEELAAQMHDAPKALGDRATASVPTDNAQD